MKKACFGVLLLMCMATLVFAQSRLMVRGYLYSNLYVDEDSSGSITWTFDGLNGDIDTSEAINISMYKKMGTMFHFSSVGAAHADSLEVSIYGIVSWNDTTYILFDSIPGPLSVADVLSCSSLGAADTCYCKDWGDLPPAYYFKIILKTYQDKTDVSDGWTMTVQNMRQP